MIVEITSPVTAQKVKETIAQIRKSKNKKSLRKHFGKLKRGIDAVTYQKKTRNEWV